MLIIARKDLANALRPVLGKRTIKRCIWRRGYWTVYAE